MISFDLDNNNNLTITCDPIDIPIQPREIIAQAAHSIDINFIDTENEGAPVNFGNSYAEYQFKIYNPKTNQTLRFGIGSMECNEINHKLSITSEPEEIE